MIRLFTRRPAFIGHLRRPPENTITGNLATLTFTANGTVLCPDLLALEDLGVADNLRGRVVRAFFWLLRWWRP